MSKEFDFIKDCGYFYVLTINKDFPAGRPFGAMMEDNNKLYISTNPGNHAHLELRKNGNIQIIAKKDGTRKWLRITGKATECSNIKMKEKMLVECPILSTHYSSAEDENFLLFQIDIIQSEFH